ncbi:hypothetical protein LTR56_021161 [Elasticomyces elasticus]|nr:hypothetical protein LTR56_021161 [Elasticomyces elasticus]KAK3631836.1 hypothetical protein LTR22_020904 [Elasticomyces elasticus]KAK4909692.1 hypothetical protein LTR49_021586 [Elasticomyces elasticus]KAK5749554.1 hypothetical protein LTS12_020420 [Elasticomyces elasticus]
MDYADFMDLSSVARTPQAQLHPQGRLSPSTQPTPKNMAPPSNPLLSGIKELYLSGLYSDLTIVSWGKSFKVHKNVLHAQSSVFRTMLSGKFKVGQQHRAFRRVGSTYGGQPDTLTLNHDNADELAVMLHFFYHSSLPTPAECAYMTEPAFMVYVYKMAEKFDVPALCAAATSRFSELLHPMQDLSNYELFCTALMTIDENVSTAKLWDIAVPRIVDNMSWLAHNDKFCDLLQRMPELNQKLLISAAEALTKARAQPPRRQQEGMDAATSFSHTFDPTWSSIMG